MGAGLRLLTAHFEDLEGAGGAVVGAGAVEAQDGVGEGEGAFEVRLGVGGDDGGHAAGVEEDDDVGPELGRSEGAGNVDDDDAGEATRDLGGEGVEDAAGVAFAEVAVEVDEVDVAVEAVGVEEGELGLVVAEAVGALGWTAEVDRRLAGGGVGERELLGEGGFTGAGGADDEGAGAFGQAAAEDLVEAGDAGG